MRARFASASARARSVPAIVARAASARRSTDGRDSSISVASVTLWWPSVSITYRIAAKERRGSARSAAVDQKQRLQIVQEPSAERRRSNDRRIVVDQVARRCELQPSRDERQRIARTLRDQRRRSSVRKTQRVQHELKADIVAADLSCLLQRRSGRDTFEILRGMLEAYLAHDPIRKRELGMRAGTDAEIIAETPIVEIVAALESRARMRRCFVMAIAGIVQHRTNRVLDVGRRIFVGQRRRMAMKERIRLERERIERQMGGRERERRRDVGPRLGRRLPRQRVHEIEIDVAED